MKVYFKERGGKKMNVYEKLLELRKEFRKRDIFKSGVNPHAGFKYYELADFVPIAEELLCDLNLVYLINFTDSRATGTLVDVLNPENSIEFAFDVQHIAEPAKFRMNEIQATGAEITYIRRYLYYLLLELTDPDKLDGEVGKPLETTRKEIQQGLTNAGAEADPKQIEALKTIISQLGNEHLLEVEEILKKTNDLTNLTKQQAELLIISLRGKVVDKK